MNIKWIPIDKDNLYRQEVLAINTSYDMLVGYLSDRRDDNILCDTSFTPLENVTHYIPVTELVKLIKLQTNGSDDISLDEPCKEHPLDRVIYRGDDKLPLCSKCGHEIQVIVY